MTFSRFEAIGTYLPSRVVTTDELIGQLAEPPTFDFAAVTGVQERRFRSTDPDDLEDSFTLACKAVDECLARSRYEAEDLDVVISTSITRTRGERMYFEPSFAAVLAQRIGAHRAIHFDLSNACAGMLTGTYILDAMIRSGAARRGIVVSGEAITPIAETAVREISEKYDLQFASLSVGDSASAVVLDESVDEADRIHYVDLMTAAEYADACLGMPSEKTQGIALYTDNRRMHNESRFKLWTDAQGEYLDATGRSFGEEGFDYIIHHQFGASAVNYMNELAEREFGVPMPPSPGVVEKYGNTSTTSHFVVLHDCLQQRSIPKGSKILMVPAASGIVTGYLSTTITSLEA
ncbi:3-oxoacyl-ACP synthase [Rhodococcus triatomae]|uniref:3-oxoacyl-[acyl-carrier-protein] synthase-3 n=1 Tax=Rhodococcus triatomae TaxID=300028 RepID=A0A1G8L733_9NOCA|nr:3-oxoacyl-[acyl-carrier-protein] synthase III C-terminal domain-containing protein [Rhodococcus triatomae]QNG20522.1 3-oxoacyl-ACP synthase [Rhodococcus triatomae]QNG23560.1 3-oxoacyl-ACP synthase [Rhodococcus triatomae]SDI51422.1 3-oxoacyl-[acyl-carrier-protein] synthase-3 [Rhodococcus triatomae]